MWGVAKVAEEGGRREGKGRKCVGAHVYCPIAGVYGLKQQMKESQSLSRKKVISS